MKVMTIYAHPADTITNCGGALARHADAGDEIHALILTHGGRIHPNVYAQEWRKEHPDEHVLAAGLADIAANKRRELERAAEIIGIHDLVLLDHDDTMSTVHEDVVEEVAEQIVLVRPDVVVADYPQNAVQSASSHTIATMTALAAIDRAASYLKNLDGHEEVNVRQVFFTGLPVCAPDALSVYGLRNDTFIDITPVVGRKIAAVDCFVSQGYDGAFARKVVESNNGEFGRAAGVNFAEGYVRHRNETHALFPVTSAAMQVDPLTRHVAYSQVSLREAYPVASHSA
ncbi:MAG: PIG-L family deacetylase [Actinomycetota bacterium]|nr:PIG-L family deacetylase [Actinomycetota bacterium]